MNASDPTVCHISEQLDRLGNAHYFNTQCLIDCVLLPGCANVLVDNLEMGPPVREAVEDWHDVDRLPRFGRVKQ